jgi:multidrug transporter EmrE-like cation transporter
MPSEVILAVLLAAVMHAGWNTIAKRNVGGGNAVVVGVMAAWPALLVLPFAGAPSRAAWSALVASSLIHIVYFRVLARAYTHGELSIAYPLMRGVPPLVVAAVAALFLGEMLNVPAWLGVAVLVAGVLVLGWDGFSAGALNHRSARYVAIQVVVIAAYTLVDAAGVRASGNPLAYIAWLFVLTAIALVVSTRAPLVAAYRNGGRTLPIAAAGGALTFASYAVVLWAMTRAPVALVAALRETSSLFGAAFGALLLDERFGVRRWVALALIGGGVAAMRLA